MNIHTFVSRTIVSALCAVTLACGSTSPTAPSSTPTPPQSTDVSPAVGTRGTSVPVTLTGAQFAAGATTAVAVSGDGVSVTNVAVQSTTTVTATLTIAPDAALGARAISVTHRGGTSPGLTFTVLPPPPTLDAVTPPLVQAGASAVLTLTGTHFISGATTVAISGPGLSVSDVSVVDATTLTVTVSASQAADIGTRKVTVTTPGGSSPDQPIGIIPPPIAVTSVSSTRLRVGETATIAISGSGFVPGVTTLTSNHPALQVSNVRVLNAASAPIRRARNTTFAAGTGKTLYADLTAAFDAAFSREPVDIGLSLNNSLDKMLSLFDVSFPELLELVRGLLSESNGAIGPFGQVNVNIPIVVTPPLPQIGAFEAVPGIVSLGQSSTLKWRGIENATTCSVSLIGDVPCADGTVAVSPSATTEYRLTVVGPGGDSEWATATVVVEAAPAPPVTTPSSSTTFSATGTHSFTVPAGASQVTIEASGAAGGAGAGSTPSNAGAAGGLGGRVTATVAVTPGETLTVVVGVGGSTAVNGGAYGFGGNGAGVGGNGGSTGLGGGGGGGASSVSRGSTVLALAGGGGGGGGNFGAVSGGAGGAGGGAGAAGNGQTAASSASGGLGATQAAVGTGGAGAGHPGGNGSAGSGRDAGVGGPAATASSGAGGGGGGGAFGGGGGGGGSQFSGTAQSGGGGGGGSSTTIGSATNVTHAQGVRSGNGLVVIRW